MQCDRIRFFLPAIRRAQAHESWAVILAAGESTRMGRNKALLPLGRFTFVERILALYADLELPVCVVVGRDADRLAAGDRLSEARVLRNLKPELGPLSSLRLAVRSLARASAVIVHPVDHPLVATPTLQRLQRTHRNNPGSILIPVDRGRKGHPVLFPSRFFTPLRESPLELGAREVVRRNLAATQWVPVEDEGILANLNTQEQWRQWSLRLSGRWS